MNKKPKTKTFRAFAIFFVCVVAIQFLPREANQYVELAIMIVVASLALTLYESNQQMRHEIRQLKDELKAERLRLTKENIG